MTVPFSARRRAEEFDALLDGGSSPASRTALDERAAARFADLLAVVDDLRAIPGPEPRPEFTASLRSRLMAEADTVLVQQSARVRADEARLVLPQRPRARDRRLATLLGGAALVGATTSMAVAAQTALPGDALYPVKRVLEDARTEMASSDTARGTLLLASAGDRLQEVDELARASAPVRDAAVADTLVAFSEQATEASDALLAAYAESGDEQVVRTLHDFAGTSMDQLSALDATVPGSARDELVAAGRTVAEIDRRAATACPSCGDVTTLPPFLLTATALGQDVGTVLTTSSTSIVDRGRTGQPAIPVTISGQDVGGIVVPELDTTLTGPLTGETTDDPGEAITGGAGAGTGTGEGATGGGGPTRLPDTGTGTEVVQGTVDDVTKLLTGDVPPLVNEVPVVGPVVGPTVDGLSDGTAGGVDGTVDGTLDGVGDTLDQATDPLLD
jgi:hypothetical protein